MNVLVVVPGHGSEWLVDAVFVRADGTPSRRGRSVRGKAWTYDGGWNMPDDYRGQYETVWVPRRWVRRVEP